MADKDIISEAQEAFKLCQDHSSENRLAYIEDVRFARLAEQWPDGIRQQRERETRPCLTINKLPQFLRQVINDARQNRPSISVKPVDSNADRRTASIYDGLIRNIEVSSNADVAYDTGLDCAVSGGFGFFRVDVDYAYDDSFDLDIRINRVVNPLTIYGDPRSVEADSCDWNISFISEMIPEADFKRRYPKADLVSFEDTSDTFRDWKTDDEVRIAEYWKRTEITKTVIRLSNGMTLAEDVYLKNRNLFDAQNLQVTGTREIAGYEVNQYLLTGAEVLKTVRWAGKYIPIVPVYGDELNIEGKRYFLSLVRHAKDPQRMFNYWRTAATELVALAPRVPFIGPKGFARSDPNWETVNLESHPYLEYDGPVAPQRQPLDSGAAAGALQEAMNASDDMKAVMGIYDASLGARSNETSGRAIVARQREGDTSTYHFIDNLSRSIRHAGRILVDLIPKVYTNDRIVRVLGEDGSTQQVPLGQPVQQPDGTMFIYDLSAGKYDVVVKAGPSFTTRRDEAATQMIEFVRNFPPAAPVMGDIVARNLDWPEADKIEARMKALLPPPLNGGPSPEMMQMQQQMQQMGQQLQMLQQQNAEMQLQLKNKADDHQIKQGDLQIKQGELTLQSRELDIKERELLLEAAKMQGEAETLRAQLQEAGASTNSMSQAIEMLQQQINEARAEFSRPRNRTGRAMKMPDGSWQLTATETATEESPTIQ